MSLVQRIALGVPWYCGVSTSLQLSAVVVAWVHRGLSTARLATCRRAREEGQRAGAQFPAHVLAQAGGGAARSATRPFRHGGRWGRGGGCVSVACNRYFTGRPATLLLLRPLLFFAGSSRFVRRCARADAPFFAPCLLQTWTLRMPSSRCGRATWPSPRPPTQTGPGWRRSRHVSRLDGTSGAMLPPAHPLSTEPRLWSGMPCLGAAHLASNRLRIPPIFSCSSQPPGCSQHRPLCAAAHPGVSRLCRGVERVGGGDDEGEADGPEGAAAA